MKTLTSLHHRENFRQIARDLCWHEICQDVLSDKVHSILEFDILDEINDRFGFDVATTINNEFKFDRVREDL